MLSIKKMRADHTIDFAAEELKKYLRMMMPEGGEISIFYDPDAKDGFRLGLLEDFGLESEAEDIVLDDVVHIDTTEKGGILAGSNPRSVLFSVYRFLRENGCRWLYPGIDGEFIPLKKISPTRYHKMADHRFRGHCNEGAESQTCMIETIDFYAKQEINVYMIEFDNPFTYYNSYYNHLQNEKNRDPEPIPEYQALQWKRMCEAEIAKRGLMFHDMGHGWTAEPYGISSVAGWAKSESLCLTEKQRSYLAELDGKRELFHGVPLNTNLCMSNPEVRNIMADSVVEYAKAHQNVTYLHVWLADGNQNHCECDECRKMRPSDWYLMIMNELDEKLSAEGLDMRIVFIAYFDTLFAPEKITIQNPRRFSLLWAPITRTYSESIQDGMKIPPAPEYLRNAWKRPKSAEENLSFLREWQKRWLGNSFSYEYHFWRHQYMDPGGILIAKRIYEDIKGLSFAGLSGFVEDGSQRSFWPNGFAIYVYAEALLDREKGFDEILEDYFSRAYGEDWRDAKKYFERISAAFDPAFMAGEKSKNEEISNHFDPDRKSVLDSVKEIAAEGKRMASMHLSMPKRPQTVSWRLLLYHAEYCEKMASWLGKKCMGQNYAALEEFYEFADEFGKREIEIERYYDHYLATKSLLVIARNQKKFQFFS